MDETTIKKLVCPYDHSLVFLKPSAYFACRKCKRRYPIGKEGIANFLPDELRSAGVDECSNNGLARIENNIGRWQPGLRYWNPGVFVNILRCGRGTGRLLDKQVDLTMLDVGCGGNAQGDVNVDIYIPNPLPQNFILASAELLPFENNSFDIVRSAYVIEHNLFPIELIKEHFRVCRKMVKTYTDNSDWIGAIILRIFNTGFIFHDEHYYKWSKEYFTNILDRLGLDGRVFVLNTSPSYLVRTISLLGKLPRVGPIFYRDLYIEIYKNRVKDID